MSKKSNKKFYKELQNYQMDQDLLIDFQQRENFKKEVKKSKKKNKKKGGKKAKNTKNKKSSAYKGTLLDTELWANSKAVQSVIGRDSTISAVVNIIGWLLALDGTKHLIGKKKYKIAKFAYDVIKGIQVTR